MRHFDHNQLIRDVQLVISLVIAASLGFLVSCFRLLQALLLSGTIDGDAVGGALAGLVLYVAIQVTLNATFYGTRKE